VPSDADAVAHDAQTIVDDYDFSFQGVLTALKGFPAISALSSSLLKPANRSNSRRPSHSPPTVLDDVTRSLRRGDYAKNKEARYTSAVTAFNQKIGTSSFTIASSRRPQRQLALSICGPDYSVEDIEPNVKRYEREGQHGKACAISFFSGNTSRAVRSLQASEGTFPQLCFLTMVLRPNFSQTAD